MDYGADLPPSESQRIENEFIYIEKRFKENPDDLNFTLDSQDPYGWTPLHYLMAKENIEIEPFLQQIQPEVLEKALLKRTSSEITPLQLALKHQSDENCEQLITNISADTVCKIMLTKTRDYNAPLEFAFKKRPYVADLLLSKLTAETLKKFLPTIIYDLARILPHDRLKLLLEQVSPQIINQALLRTWSLFTISSVTNLKKAPDQHNFIYLILVWAYSFLNAAVAEKEQANRLAELKDWWKLTHEVLGKKKSFSQTFKNHIENNTFFKTSWFYTNYRDIRNALLKVDNVDDEIISEALDSYWDYLELRKSITTDKHEKQLIEMLLSDQEPHSTIAKIDDPVKESDKIVTDKELVEDITNSSPMNTF